MNLRPVAILLILLILDQRLYGQGSPNQVRQKVQSIPPLIEAAQSLDVAKATTLLKHSADINVRDKNGWTPLIWAAHHWNSMGVKLTPMIQLLLDRGAKIDGRDNLGRTALMYAAEAGNSDVITILLDHGANVNAIDREGCTPLMWLVNWTTYDVIMGGKEEQHLDIARLMLKRGAKLNVHDNEGATVLMHAIGWDHPTIAMGLVEIGADVTLRDKRGRTALTNAASFGKSSRLVQTLLNHGATVGVMDALLLDDEAKAVSLIQSKADISACGPRGETALIAAAERGYTQAVEALLARGVDPNAKEDDGLPAVILAIAGRLYHSQTGSVLMTGAKTPGRVEIVRALIAAHADVKLPIAFSERSGQTRTITPQSWAKEHGSTEVIKVLAEGVDK